MTSAESMPGVPRDAESQRTLRLLVDVVQEYAIFMLAPDGTVASWNPGAQRIKGYAAEEVIGQHFSLFYPPEDVKAGKPDRELAHAVEHGDCQDEGWRVRKDGTTFWANVVITAIFDGAGELQGFAKVTRDESDRRLAEEQGHRLERVMDRERIAANLHQAVVHRIFDAGLGLQGALRLISDPTAAQRVQDTIDLLDDTVKEIRAVVLDLTPPPAR